MRTSHGHHIPGTDMTPVPEDRVNCGGSDICELCKDETDNAPLNDPKPEPTAPTEHALHRDNRSLTDEEIKNRFGYHAGTERTQPMHQINRMKFIEMATFLDRLLPAGRAKIVALTELEAAAMWANKAIAEMAPVVSESGA